MNRSPPTSAVGGVARAVGAQLLVGGSAGQGTELAVGAPAAATPATALGPGDRLAATGLSLARGLQHLGEAGPLPGVWKERVGMVGGRDELSGCPFPVASSGVESLHMGSQHLRRMCARARGGILQAVTAQCCYKCPLGAGAGLWRKLQTPNRRGAPGLQRMAS